MNLKCLIVDDEPIARKVVREFVQRISFLELRGEAEDPLVAQRILDKEPVDLVFLDIEMPGMNGMSFLRGKTYTDFLTIITTAYPSYAVEGFEMNVVDYLMKPISFERFAKACEKARQYFEMKVSPQKEFFFVKSEGRIEKIEFHDLLYVESLGNYVTLHLSRGKMIVYLTLKGLLAQLPESFTQVHKSYIINRSKVKRIDGNEIVLEGHTVPIGVTWKEDALKQILGDRVIKR